MFRSPAKSGALSCIADNAWNLRQPAGTAPSRKRADVGNVISDTDEADGEGETLNAPLKVLFCNGPSDLTPTYEGCPAEPRRTRNTITLYSFDSEVAGPPPRKPSS